MLSLRVPRGCTAPSNTPRRHCPAPGLSHVGIGSALLYVVMAEATQAGQPVRIHVETQNPALRLYTRLGFRPIADRGVYWFLEWSPAPASPGAEPG